MPDVAEPLAKKDGPLASDVRTVRAEERRAFPRWPISIPAVCYSKRKRFECVLTDLNETGACFRSAEQPQVGDTLILAFALVNGKSEPTTLECDVRHVAFSK